MKKYVEKNVSIESPFMVIIETIAEKQPAGTPYITPPS